MINKIKTLDDFKFENKLVIVRADINSEIINGKPSLSDRIIKTADNISELKRKKAKVIIISHQGRKGKRDFTSLENHSKLISKYAKLKFVKDIIGEKAEEEIKKLKSGEAIMLENIRNLDEELDIKKSKKIIDFFRRNGVQIYINDSFSVSHRKQTSITELPKYFDSGMGRTFERELKNISKIKIGKCMYILGGNKPEDLVDLFNNKKIYASGVLAILRDMYDGINFGLENKIRKKELEKLKRKFDKFSKNIVKAEDYGFKISSKRVDLDKENLPINARALDLGRKSIEKITKQIMKEKFVFLKGTAGDCSIKKFDYGTKKIFLAMKKSKAFCVIAGGHSSTMLKKMKISEKDIGYVSLSGGALIQYISGNKLPGLEVLKK